MKITTIGIDLAKEIFQIHGVDSHGKAVLRKQLRRREMVGYLSNVEPCLIGMEACGSAHDWARKLSEWTYSKTDGLAICKTVCEDSQEQYGVCRSDF